MYPVHSSQYQCGNFIFPGLQAKEKLQKNKVVLPARPVSRRGHRPPEMAVAAVSSNSASHLPLLSLYHQLLPGMSFLLPACPYPLSGICNIFCTLPCNEKESKTSNDFFQPAVSESDINCIMVLVSCVCLVVYLYSILVY